MPSIRKTLHFISSALVTAVSVGVLGFALSTEWAAMSMECSQSGTELFNGSAVITLKLFNGHSDRIFCPFFRRPENFQVFPELGESGGMPLVLHGLSVGLLVLCLVSSSGSILISLYNSVSNPYETYMGPIGVYTCSSLSACSSFAVLLLFVVNVNVSSLAEDLVKVLAQESPVDLRNKQTHMRLGYYLLIPHSVLSLLAILLIYLYQHAAYTHRREQQRPTEDTPKEIMMY